MNLGREFGETVLGAKTEAMCMCSEVDGNVRFDVDTADPTALYKKTNICLPWGVHQ